jgi:hypothetical protein
MTSQISNEITECTLQWSPRLISENILLQAMCQLFKKHPNLLKFTFDPHRPELRESPDELLQQARALSSGENVLVRIAMDLWNQSGDVRLWEVIERLDTGNFHAVIATLRLLGPKPPHTPDIASDSQNRNAAPEWNEALF